MAAPEIKSGTLAKQRAFRRLEALAKIQRSLNLTPARAREWIRRNKAERRASSARLERSAR